MSDDNSRRRFKANPTGKNALYADYGPKEKNNHLDFDQDTKKHVEEMKRGNSNILVAISPQLNNLLTLLTHCDRLQFVSAL